jgi:uncharacterized protein
MTPQESQLVDELFDRLATLETAPRDPEAERLIADGSRRAPHAIYALVQTTLLQDEALKRANTRIEDLQAQLDEAPQPEQRQGSFLDSMREAFGGASQRGSVPSVRAQSGPPPGYQSQSSQPGYPPPPGYGPGPAFGGGGSFLGTAASTAAGFIGGALLLDGIRSMFGHHSGGYAPSAAGDFGDRGSPWTGSATDSQLARDAGINDIGHHVRDAGGDRSASGGDASQNTDDTFQTADNDDFADDNDTDGDADSDFGGDFGGGDSSDA